MNRPLSAPASDIALVVTRVILAVVMFAHGYQKLFLQGIGRTTEGFERMNIPLAIVSASFVTVMEVAGAVLLVCGALTTVVCALYLFEFIGAIVFVHGEHGLFVQQGGAEYVLVICALVIALAAIGPGRYSVDHRVRERQRRHESALARLATEPVAAVPAAFATERPAARLMLPEPFAPDPAPLPVRPPRPARTAR